MVNLGKFSNHHGKIIKIINPDLLYYNADIFSRDQIKKKFCRMSLILVSVSVFVKLSDICPFKYWGMMNLPNDHGWGGNQQLV